MPGGAAEGGPARGPDVDVVCAHQGQFSTCAADGESHVAGGGHVTEMEDPTRTGVRPPDRNLALVAQGWEWE
jgi:hypothetical protein